MRHHLAILSLLLVLHHGFSQKITNKVSEPKEYIKRDEAIENSIYVGEYHHSFDNISY